MGSAMRPFGDAPSLWMLPSLVRVASGVSLCTVTALSSDYSSLVSSFCSATVSSNAIARSDCLLYNDVHTSARSLLILAIEAAFVELSIGVFHVGFDV